MQRLLLFWGPCGEASATAFQFSMRDRRLCMRLSFLPVLPVLLLLRWQRSSNSSSSNSSRSSSSRSSSRCLRLYSVLK